MTAAEFKALLRHHQLRYVDAAWLMGRHERVIKAWANGESPVPRAAALVMHALNERKISPAWCLKKIKEPPP